MNATKFLSAHNKVVRRNGNVWKIISLMIGKFLLVSAEVVVGPDKGTMIPNLQKSRSAIAKELKASIELGLVS